MVNNVWGARYYVRETKGAHSRREALNRAGPYRGYGPEATRRERRLETMTTERIPKCEKHGTRAMREIPQRLLGLRLWLCEACSSEAVKTWTRVKGRTR